MTEGKQGRILQKEVFEKQGKTVKVTLSLPRVLLSTTMNIVSNYFAKHKVHDHTLIEKNIGRNKNRL